MTRISNFINNLLGGEKEVKKEADPVNNFVGDLIKIFNEKYKEKPEKIENIISSQGEKLISLKSGNIQVIFNYKKEIVKELIKLQ